MAQSVHIPGIEAAVAIQPDWGARPRGCFGFGEVGEIAGDERQQRQNVEIERREQRVVGQFRLDRRAVGQHRPRHGDDRLMLQQRPPRPGIGPKLFVRQDQPVHSVHLQVTGFAQRIASAVPRPAHRRRSFAEPGDHPVAVGAGRRERPKQRSTAAGDSARRGGRRLVAPALDFHGQANRQQRSTHRQHPLAAAGGADVAALAFA